jgi:hypothetical protein
MQVPGVISLKSREIKEGFSKREIKGKGVLFSNSWLVWYRMAPISDQILK